MTQAQTSEAVLASILVVDDRKSDLELTRIMLMDALRLECNLMTAQSGKIALDLLHQEYNENRPVDLVLLDINMPGMDGFEVLELIRANTLLSQLRVVMCTGSTYHKDMERAESLGVAGYLVKPVPMEMLRETIEQTPSLQLHETQDGYAVRRVA